MQPAQNHPNWALSCAGGLRRSASDKQNRLLKNIPGEKTCTNAKLHNLASLRLANPGASFAFVTSELKLYEESESVKNNSTY